MEQKGGTMRHFAPVWDTSQAHQQLRGTARDLKSGHARRPAAPQSHSPGSEPSEVQFEQVIRRPQCSPAGR
eukprot:scaffold48918_cov72-Phaeocystis_antarctica.AAC.1